MEAREFEAGMEFSGDGVAIYQSVVESLEECAIFMIDASGTMMSWNPGVESMLGYTREEFIGLPYEALFPAEEIGAAQRELEETRTNGRARDNRWHRRRDGGRFWADGVLVAVRDGERFIGYVKILRDDGDRRRLDEELAETRRQKERFLAMVSHELRTPLMAILGWVRVLQDGEVEAGDLRTALQIIEQNALAQRRLVEELIDAAQLITGSIELERSDIDLRATVLSEIDTARERATEKGIAFESSVGSEAVMMHADEQRIRQIIGGLLSNAVKYTLVQGTVHVELIASPAEVELIVTDSGVGIEPEFLPHLFERFRRAASTSPLAESGVGLGLSIVRELVELHGGSISVTSEGVGRGARFVVRLPRR